MNPKQQIFPDKDKNVKIYTKYDICGKCKGACCKTRAGIYAPEDFTNSITVDYVTALLLTKKFAVDFHDAVPLTAGNYENIQKNYFIRPRHMDESDEYAHYGICVNWSYEKGCSLSEQNRPFQCRMLVPFLNKTTCSVKDEDRASHFDMGIRWKPHQGIIKEAIRKYQYIKDLIEITDFMIDDNVAIALENIVSQIRLIYEQKDEV